MVLGKIIDFFKCRVFLNFSYINAVSGPDWFLVRHISAGRNEEERDEIILQPHNQQVCV